MIEQIREAARRVLTEGRVDVVIGYGQTAPGRAAHPLFVRTPAGADMLVWNEFCRANLVSCLTRREVKALGRAAVIVKGCDERALVMLEKEAQIERASVYVIGVACDRPEGVGQPKCAACETPAPRFADELIGEPAPARAGGAPARLEEFMRLPREERFAFWKSEFERCVKCYACRQACPLCYCERCIVDKNRPQAIETSATLRGNFAWNITRAFHLAARCVGCGECVSACPAGIELDLLNASLARAAQTEFGFKPGMDPDADLVAGSFSKDDKEDFIG